MSVEVIEATEIFKTPYDIEITQLESVYYWSIRFEAFTSLFSCNFAFSVCAELPLLYDLYFYVDNSATTLICTDSQL